MNIDEQRLLQHAISFDREALAEIYDHFSPGLYRYAWRLLGEASLAEDCLSETFMRFLQALAAHKGPRDHLQAYLYRIAHNWIIDHYRSSPPLIRETNRDDLPSTEPLPETLLARRDQRQIIRSALMKLTPDQRQVIVLRYIEEWGLEEVASALEKPYGAIKSLQHRGLATLKKTLQIEEEG
jgi:RNA polymerase sigma-70 factor, ECF subfamily